MKRQNNKKHGKKTLIVLSLLGLAFVAALFLGAVKIYAIFQEKELQEKVSVLISQEVITGGSGYGSDKCKICQRF